MTQLNITLFLIVIALSISVVTSQHKARKLYIELEELQQIAKKYNVEYGQLQLEQSTWAMHSRVEEMATKQLKMQVPESKQIQVIFLDGIAK